MNTKAVLCVLVVLALLSTGCAEYATYTPNAMDLTTIAQLPEGPTKSAVQATAIARYVAAEDSAATVEAAGATARAAGSQQATAQAREQHQRAQMTAEAQAVAAQATAQAQAIEDARASAAAATVQALNVRATEQAMHVAATQQVMDWNATAMAEARNSFETVEARNATAMAEARNATATTVAQNATATTMTRLDNAQATAVQATAASVARQEERERITQPLLTFAPWLLGAIGVVSLVILGTYAWRLFEDRARLVRRNPDEGEPIMLITRERMALPLRQFGSYQDMTHGQENAPLLAPTVEAQEGATMRQQTANAIQARQVGAVARAKSKAPVIVNGQSRRAPARPRSRNRVSVPGLVKVVAVGDLAEATAQGILPPRLAEAIEGQWTEMQEKVEQ